MLTTSAVETTNEYIFTITDDNDTFEYRWGKQPPQGQTASSYLQSCKHESELLAQLEINQKAPPKFVVI